MRRKDDPNGEIFTPAMMEKLPNPFISDKANAERAAELAKLEKPKMIECKKKTDVVKNKIEIEANDLMNLDDEATGKLNPRHSLVSLNNGKPKVNAEVKFSTHKNEPKGARIIDVSSEVVNFIDSRANITLKNLCPSDDVTFKIMSTAPQLFAVSPVHGKISASGTEFIEVKLGDSLGRNPLRHKLMIEATKIEAMTARDL